MSDTNARWLEAEALFDELVHLPPDERNAALDAAVGQDAEMRDLLISLLNADSESGQFLASAISDAAEEVQSRVGETVGAYRLVAELGRGGMGAVYLAERADDEYQAKVAMKFLRTSLARPELEQRFRSERQILADLVHPNIARLLDGGTASDGSPYLVMEHVEGLPLDEWCEREKYGIRGRVSLMRRVCDAVQHAHQSFVVHRDLKPSNILVTDGGVPKLLDFGIATLVKDEDEGGDVTQFGAMTPSYASPEQLQGRRVTTASDTYSLGVVLYRLLARKPPYALNGLTPAEVERTVTGAAPPPPSTHASGDNARALRGDLDTIVLKALRVDPADRYLTAADLAEDLRRWLANEPILARRPSAFYRLQSFARRHPVGVTASTLAVAALVALALYSSRQATIASLERDRAEARQRVSEEATDFLVSLFELADPNVNNGEAITAREMLDRGSQRILSGSIADPDVRTTLAISMATIYRNLAEYSAASPLIDTALAVRSRVNGELSTEYGAALHERAELLYNEGSYDSAAVAHRRVLEIQDVAAPGDNDLTEATLDGLGATLDELNQLKEGEAVLRRALAMSRRLRGDTGVIVSQSYLALAAVLRTATKYDEAIPLLEESLRLATASVGRKNLDVAQSLNHLARTLTLVGRSEEAVPYAQESVDILKAVHAGPHPETGASLGNLAGILRSLGRLPEAEVVRRESLAIMQAVFPEGHPYVAATLNSLADLQMLKEEYPAAEATYRQSLTMNRKFLSKNNPDLAYQLTGLGRAMLAQGRPADAEPLLREAYSLRKNNLPEGHWFVAASGTALGEALTKLGRKSEATSLLNEAVRLLSAQFGDDDSRTKKAKQELEAAAR